MDKIADYSGSSSSSESEDENEEGKAKIFDHSHLKKPSPSSALSVLPSSAPEVLPNEKMDSRRHIDPNKKEVDYNPKYEDMFAPMVGPSKSADDDEDKPKNMLTGFVEEAHINEFQFELQRKTFHSYGFAQCPEQNKLIGDEDKAQKAEFKSVFEDTKVRRSSHTC